MSPGLRAFRREDQAFTVAFVQKQYGPGKIYSFSTPTSPSTESCICEMRCQWCSYPRSSRGPNLKADFERRGARLTDAARSQHEENVLQLGSLLAVCGNQSKLQIPAVLRARPVYILRQLADKTSTHASRHLFSLRVTGSSLVGRESTTRSTPPTRLISFSRIMTSGIMLIRLMGTPSR